MRMSFFSKSEFLNILKRTQFFISGLLLFSSIICIDNLPLQQAQLYPTSNISVLLNPTFHQCCRMAEEILLPQAFANHNSISKRRY